MVYKKIFSELHNRMIRLLGKLCFLLALLIPNIIYGVEIEGLYQASLLVESRDDEKERQAAYSLAMQEVLVKVSGTNEFLSSNAVRRAINRPESYVESYIYRTIEESAPVTQAATQTAIVGGLIELEIFFYETEILRLLDANNIPLWPANRPPTLLWIVVEDELGEREMLSSISVDNKEILDLLKASASKRGMPLVYPLMDLEDRQALGTDELWELDEEKLLQASQRYQAESILALRLYKSLSGELIGKSVYLFRGRALSYSSYEDDVATFIESAISMSTEELSGYYAVLISGSTKAIVVDMKIDGINTAKDYADLLNYVGGLTDVSSFHIASVDQQSIKLKLSTGGQLRQLVETIALQSFMEPIVELQRNNDEITMHYQWKEQR